MKRISFATGSFHVAAVVYLLLGVISLMVPDFFFESYWTSGQIASLIVVMFLLVFLLEVLIHFLKQRRKGAWYTGLVVAIIFTPSIFIVLGILALIGLLSQETKKEFGIGNSKV